MEVATHAMWGHDFKLIVDPNGDTTAFYNDIKRMNPEQRANWMDAYESENQEFLANKLTGKNSHSGNSIVTLKIIYVVLNQLTMVWVKF